MQENTKFISLMKDMTFKTLWVKGSVGTKKYLNRIITKIVGFDVSDFILFSNELGLNNYKSIANKVDILLVSQDKKIKVNIELNKSYSEYLIRKNDTYIYKLAGETYDGKKNDEKYKYEINVTQVNIDGFYNPENKNISTNYYVLADPVNNLVRKGIKIYDLYLPKITEMCYDDIDETYIDLAMFLAKSYKDMKLLVGKNMERKAVMEDLEKLGSDPEFVDYYDHDEFQEILMEEAQTKAREQGHAEGLEQAKIEQAKIMLEHGEDIEKICLYTRLPKETILTLNNK